MIFKSRPTILIELKLQMHLHPINHRILHVAISYKIRQGINNLYALKLTAELT
jgi:hypothetical protein